MPGEDVRLHVEVRDGVDLEMALDCVCRVVALGRISTYAGKACFCWHTVFPDEAVVSVRQPDKRRSGSDSFVVYKETKR